MIGTFINLTAKYSLIIFIIKRLAQNHTYRNGQYLVLMMDYFEFIKLLDKRVKLR
jgi:hypothetical protein